MAEAGKNYRHGPLDTRRFAQALAQHLGLETRYVQPAYEDAINYLKEEAELPVNLDPTRANLDDPLERQSLADKLSRGLNSPVGYVLPLAWRPNGNAASGHWHSAVWQTRRDRLYLSAGDSPMGLRLPLASLPWVAEEQRDPWVETDPFAPQLPLANFHGEVAARYSTHLQNPPAHPEIHPQTAPGKQSVEVPHTALCVEVRHGCVHVFMPPVTTLEQYLDILAAVEATAVKLKLPVFIEGYTPPNDNRLEKLMVTPDPGVIEVNIHPAQNWAQLVDMTTTLYEEARLSRLSAEKFMLDGRHSGTGGGNHVTFGGATPADSPFLRRPDLLASMITYWQHHPALSYLFSGLFIGPTSQAPRVDEGRDRTSL